MKKQNIHLFCLRITFLISVITPFNSTSIARDNWTTSDVIKITTNGDLAVITSVINHTEDDARSKDFIVYTILMTAANIGQKKVVQFLLESENIHLKKFDLHMAFIFSIEGGHKQIVQLLINFIDINLQDEHDDNQTALMIAVGNNQKDIAQLLIAAGANVDLQDDYDRNALMIAAEKGYEDIAQLLIDSGANTDLTDIYGRSAFIIALDNNNDRLAQLLIDSGANVDLQGLYDRNAFNTNSNNQDNASTSDSKIMHNQLIRIRTQRQNCLKALLRKRIPKI